MNVTRENLLATATDAIDRYTAASARYAEGVAKWKKQNRAKQIADTVTRQKRLRDALSKGLRSGKPLTSDQLSAALGSNSSYVTSVGTPGANDAPRKFTLDGVLYERPDGVPLADLRALKALLETVVEDTISDGQLQRLGFKNMGWVFRAAMANAPARG